MSDLKHVYQQSYQQACLLELKAIKPGNVGYHSDGHGMRVEQFEISAIESSNGLFKPCSCIGERILNAVQATHEAVGDNTNLGIILLSAPIVDVLQKGVTYAQLRQDLSHVLRALSVQDAQYAYRAIQLALPGGMGKVENQDVANKPSVTLFEAMQMAADKDRVAYQYTHQYEDIFEHNLPIYWRYVEKWGSPQWATTAVFLSQWVRQPDSLIIRKKGLLKAREISDMIAPLADQVLASEDPADYVSDLLSLDNELKQAGINPGTTADITVATLFVAMLESDLKGKSRDEP